MQNDINYLKELKIDFKKNKSLKIVGEKYGIKIIKKNFLESLFLLNNFETNLIELDIKLSNNYFEQISHDIAEKINNLKNLQTLSLYEFHFKQNFILKLYSLKNLSIEQCINLSLLNETCLNLNALEISYCKINIPKSLLKFPRLEEIKLLSGNFSDDEKFKSIIDFKSLKKLKKYNGDIPYFLEIESELLEKTNFFISYRLFNKNMEILCLKKILSIKTLKFVKIQTYFIENADISKIIGENKSITELLIFLSIMIYEYKRFIE